MADAERSISELLDEMALRIMMVEPGDLSVVGDLVVLVEKLGATREIGNSPRLRRMGKAMEDVLGMIVMAELPDSSENYERIGKCIILMQEVLRKADDDPASEKTYDGLLKEMGYAGEASEGGGNKEGSSPSEPPHDLVVPAEEPPDEPAVAVLPAPPQPPPRPARPEPAPRPAAAPLAEETEEAEPESDEIPDFSQDLDLLTGFIEETFEHIESIEVNVLELEERPDDIEIINKIFRPFHTIKGVSGFLNLKTIQKLAHSAENLLDDVRNGKRSMNQDVIDVVLKVGDYLRAMVANLKKVLDEGPAHFQKFDITEYVEWVRRVQNGEGGAAPGAKKVTGREVGPVSPRVQDESMAVGLAEDDEEEAGSSPFGREAGSGDGRGGGVGAGRSAAVEMGKKKVGASIKVDIDKLDGLVNAVGELVIMQAMVRANPLINRIADPKLTKDFSQLSRITSELQKTAMSMRMVPIRQTFQKMIRLVRDLSKKTGKQVDLVMEGEETEIDRNMVDSIYDPLVHMMRNSVDHGVQPPAERERLGKPATGTVHLRAYQKGGNMVIEIEDDGQGLNTKKIRQKALERGLISETEALSDHDLNNLIFLPGFSTADKITDVSGRGVGMDVVKKAVEKLRGKVEVYSEPGKGSQFVIRLPLTLAIIDGIIVRVGTERYIIPTTAIQESLKPQKKHYNTVQGRGEALMVRDNLVPVIRLYEMFGVQPTSTELCDAIVVVVESEGKQRAIMVDELLGKQEVVIKSLGGLQDIKGVAGGTILGDGRVGLILDLAGLVSFSKHEAVQ